MASNNSTHANSHIFGLALMVALAISLLVALFKYQDIKDWIYLQGYKPSQRIETVATEAGLNARGQRLFYVNHPQILAGADFTSQCQKNREKSIVLGCYKDNDRGIFLYDVKDQRLHGVVEVTAAHEMLHAAYRRLSSNEREKLDQLLVDYYNNHLNDKRIKETVDSYKLTEPNDLANEMHSIFGTEIETLPENLEAHYEKYFVNRKSVVAIAQRYQSEFTGRQDRVDAYDKQLADLRVTIESNQKDIQSQQASLESQQTRLENLRSDGSVNAYNMAVDSYNRDVNSYNRLLQTLKGQISTYNNLVDQRNSIAGEYRELMGAMSSSGLPSAL